MSTSNATGTRLVAAVDDVITYPKWENPVVAYDTDGAVGATPVEIGFGSGAGFSLADAVPLGGVMFGGSGDLYWAARLGLVYDDMTDDKIKSMPANQIIRDGQCWFALLVATTTDKILSASQALDFLDSTDSTGRRMWEYGSVPSYALYYANPSILDGELTLDLSQDTSQGFSITVDGSAVGIPSDSPQNSVRFYLMHNNKDSAGSTVTQPTPVVTKPEKAKFNWALWAPIITAGVLIVGVAGYYAYTKRAVIKRRLRRSPKAKKPKK